MVAACLIAAGIVAWGQVGKPVRPDPGVMRNAYEVVSIKPDSSRTVGGGPTRTLPNGFRDESVSIASLVLDAYDIGPTMESQVVGMPAWAEVEPYDVEAKVDSDTAEAWKKISAEERWKQEQPMIQSLLADRCKLKVHRETKESPVYDLVIAKGGLKMKVATPDEAPIENLSGTKLIVHAMSIDTLIDSVLSGTDGRLVLDKTGLGERKFDFELKWAPENRRAADPAGAGPSIFTALEEQLGLKLVPSKGQVQVLVIDHIEKPSAS